MSLLNRRTIPLVEVNMYDLAIMAQTLTEFQDELEELTLRDIPRPDLIQHAVAVAKALTAYSSQSEQNYQVRLV